MENKLRMGVSNLHLRAWEVLQSLC
jgi:hypothetical protein